MPISKNITNDGIYEGNFWKNVDVRSENACWNWQGSIHTKGFGQFRSAENIYGFGNYTHRIAYVLYNGDLPADGKIYHSCGNPSCCNPKHLIHSYPHIFYPDKITW